MPSSGCKTCARSEEHTSELQSHSHLVCRLLLEKKKMEGLLLVHTAALAFRGVAPVPQHEDAFAHVVLFFFNETATTEIYPLSLHDALPIYDTATTEIYTLSYTTSSDLGGRRIIDR